MKDIMGMMKKAQELQGKMQQMQADMQALSQVTLADYDHNRRGFKNWTDNTLPVNSNGVQYVITGTRGDISGEASEILTVTFGVSSGGGMFIASSTTMPSTGIKMAA